MVDLEKIFKVLVNLVIVFISLVFFYSLSDHYLEGSKYLTVTNILVTAIVGAGGLIILSVKHSDNDK